MQLVTVLGKSISISKWLPWPHMVTMVIWLLWQHMITMVTWLLWQVVLGHFYHTSKRAMNIINGLTVLEY